MAPFFFAYGPAELLAHFTAIAEAAPGIGHYVYENPERVGYSVGVDVVARLVREVPNVHGVKDTGDSVGRIGRVPRRGARDRGLRGQQRADPGRPHRRGPGLGVRHRQRVAGARAPGVRELRPSLEPVG